MKPASFSFKKRLSSFRYAFTGILEWFKTEHNAWIHALCTGAVFIASVYFRLSHTEWIAICFSIGFVWTAEIINSCIEKAMNLISTGRDERIRIIKDLAAGSVLVAAITAAAVGCIIFLPKL